MKGKLLGSVILLTGLTVTSCFEGTTVNTYQQLQEDIAQIDDYLAANPPDEEDIIVRDASGVRMVITEMGTGIIPPTLENIIQVAYVGRMLSDGKIIETPFDQDDSFTLTLTTADNGPDVISGWKIALRMMTEGTKAQVFIPSSLAYGRSGSGAIPGNTVLVFEIELKVVHTKYEQPRLATDLGAINRYTLEKEIENVQEYPRGIKYVIEEEGTGATPGLYDQVVIRYTGKVMDEDETVFEENVEYRPTETFSSRTVNYISGLIIGLQLMSEGGKATFFVPSALAYGPSTLTNIPANSILIMEVELLEVIPNAE